MWHHAVLHFNVVLHGSSYSLSRKAHVIAHTNPTLLLISLLPESLGYTVIMIVINSFSKSLQLFLHSEYPTVFSMAADLWACLPLFFFFIQGDIISDCRQQFTSCVWAGFIEISGISINLTSGYHYKANSQVEYAKNEVGWFLWVFCAKNQEAWTKFLKWAEYAQKSLWHSPTNLSYQLYETWCQIHIPVNSNKSLSHPCSVQQPPFLFAQISLHRASHLEYLVEWKNYGPEDQCWVPCHGILDSALLRDFHAQNHHRPGPHPQREA